MHHLSWHRIIDARPRFQIHKPHTHVLGCKSVSYSKLIHGLKKSNVALDRKILANLALTDPGAFKAVVETTR